MDSANCSKLLSAGTDMHYFYSGGGKEKENKKKGLRDFLNRGKSCICISTEHEMTWPDKLSVKLLSINTILSHILLRLKK